MDQDITRYLNEHLAASHRIHLLIQKLADTHEGPGARGFFLDLQEAFDAWDLRAIQQRDGIEFWRIREGVDILTDVKRRIEFQVI